MIFRKKGMFKSNTVLIHKKLFWVWIETSDDYLIATADDHYAPGYEQAL